MLSMSLAGPRKLIAMLVRAANYIEKPVALADNPAGRLPAL